MTRRHRERGYDPDALEIALQVAQDGGPRDDARVRTAALLDPAVPIRETQRARTKERALRAFAAGKRERAGESAQDGGTHDRDGQDVHTASVELGPGARLLMADVESIDAEKAKRVAAAVEEAVALEVAWDADQ